MRIKDEYKQDALFKATVRLVNEIGFAASSVAKIARAANISPATIYVYYENKEDLLVSTYVAIKQKLGKMVLKDFNPEQPIRDIFRNIWLNMFRYISANPEYFQFAEQFANSPYSDLVEKKELEKQFEPVLQIMKKGIEQKIIKDVNFDILTAFVFYPIYSLSNKRLCKDFEKNEENIEIAFNLAWDAIKL
jgi:AcrR family transcriptional regulator